MKKLTIVFLCFVVFIPYAMGQSKPASDLSLTEFKDLLSNINASFVYPPGFKEIKPLNTERLPFQYGLKLDDADFEIWFQVNPEKADWQRYEKDKSLANPDSAYAKTSADEAVAMSGANDYINRSIPSYVLDRYNADEGRSYVLTLMDLSATKRYQYALLIVLQKNHYGSIIFACMCNEKGPAFFKNVNKLKDCFKFN